MNPYVNIFRHVLSPTAVRSLMGELASLERDDHPPGPFPNHLSKICACTCPLCTPEVLRTCKGGQEPSTEFISRGLHDVHGLLGTHPDTHCINRLACGARHLHHVDGEDSWWKLIIILNRADSGGVLSIARRCEPCNCLCDGRCRPHQPIDIDLLPGDAYGILAGRVCHGVSTVTAGVRATWALRYSGEPGAMQRLMASGRCSRFEG